MSFWTPSRVATSPARRPSVSGVNGSHLNSQKTTSVRRGSALTRLQDRRQGKREPIQEAHRHLANRLSSESRINHADLFRKAPAPHSSSGGNPCLRLAG